MIDNLIGIILLAAGSSSRLGQSKQLLLIDGKPLIIKSAEAGMEISENVTVVLGARADAHQNLLKDLPLNIVVHATWEKGMGSSLKSGLKNTLQKTPGIVAVIVIVCDQPRISSSHLKKLVDLYKAKRSGIVASFYAGTNGVPALFDQSIFPEILKIEDGYGAKRILDKLKGSVATVEFPGGEIDIDTMEDYKTYLGSRG